jgi:cyclic dehypoxanthinyl futalosine synthase
VLQTPNLNDIAARVAAGERISRADALELYLRGDLLDLGQLAQKVRFRINPENRATYLIDRNINYTNVCNSDCSFCAFYRRDSKASDAYVNSKEVIGKKIEEALAWGATRILLQGGHNDELPYQYYPDLIQWITSRYPIELNAFSPSEIHQMVKVSGKDIRTVLCDLQSAGMKGLPGGGAEILDDEIRKIVSPKKIKTQEWLDVMAVSHELGLTTTASMVIGMGEDVHHRINHLERLRELQDRSRAAGYTGFNLFISWNLVADENTPMSRSKHRVDRQVHAVEYLRNLAVSRIFLDNIPHHQSSWPTLGPHVAQMGLQFGCDDFGSTMMEENVVSQAGAPTKSKWAMSPEELQAFIRSAGFTPAQRNTSFEILKVID